MNITASVVSGSTAAAIQEAAALNQRALSLTRQRDFAGAETLYLKALRLKEHHLGREHIETALTTNALGDLYLNMSRLDDAESFLRRAIAVRMHAGPVFDAAVSIELLAQVYEAKGDLRQAKKTRLSNGTADIACGNYTCPGQTFPLEKLSACSGCKSIFYCGKACQQSDWRRHKRACKTA
ncbi:hypothetical protein BV22DRAFT_1027708 [Leucogyrophana mollusca]|uniref:Uncharacterized protein n=1 Tax=Leucogyrophana mollusca TaxID=85980 RepID=A0ACB8BZH5_9AGAM|nr:hypothetical protein BV22DRAFT_1027708 [Leucogyrophana mollusca]